LDNICSINSTAEKVKAVIEYLFNQYSSRNIHEGIAISADLTYEKAQTFLSIAIDYISEICDVTNRLCQLEIRDIKTADQKDGETDRSLDCIN